MTVTIIDRSKSMIPLLTSCVLMYENKGKREKRGEGGGKGGIQGERERNREGERERGEREEEREIERERRDIIYVE